ncbi:alcohol dehydrogenase [Devosia pacifica]|uniref:Alcohol dehydrogenase n=1 Tax=Devosia pacifica TaxID=1335967 RepID=A0A918RWT6_9HYPH|nr:iron-containing alcohol dehydrogenase [Devosia pacifica]GHA13860.1 alcohol dehydrogenase [Devosia pacifica]
MFGVARSPRNVVFGAGQRFSVGKSAAALGSRLLVVTDARLEADQEFAKLMDVIRSTGVAFSVYAGVEPELPAASLVGGVSAGKVLGAEMVLGIGGGSCIDAAKAIALLLAHGDPLSSYYGEFKVPGPTLPVIAMPTTSGTGSEVTPVAVVADADRALKVGIASPHLIPHTAICDPELTYTCPPGLTAISGADALVHAIEAFTTARRAPDHGTVHEHVFIGKNEISDLNALAAIGYIGASLEQAYANPKDETARARMMFGSLLAGQAFGVAGTSVCHAAQYPIGVLTHTPHGLGVAAMLPYALAFNRPNAGPDIVRVGRALGVEVFEESEDATVESTIRHIEQLLERIGVPQSLEALGLAASDLDWVAEHAMLSTRLVKNNPRPIDQQSMRSLIGAAHAGDRHMLSTSSTHSQAV